MPLDLDKDAKNQLISVLVTNVLIPELVPAIRALLHRQPDITDAEAIAQLQTNAGQTIATGEAWLATHGQPPS